MHIEVADVGRRRLRALGWRVCAALVLGAWAGSSGAMDPAEAQRLLEHADRIKMGQPAEFEALLGRVSGVEEGLPTPQRDFLRYLRGYQASYRGQFDQAIPLLEAVQRETADPTLRFRAAATIANVYVISTKYELAYAQLRPLLDTLPRVTDPAARQQGMAVAAYLYNQVGEYGLALNYADRIIEENFSNGACRGAQLRVEALYRSGTAQPDDPEFQAGAERCIAAGEPLIASGISVHYARLLLDRGKPDEALEVLNKHYASAMQTRYPRVIGEYNAILGQAYWKKGDVARAREYALQSIDRGVKDQPTEPLAMAYHTLYQVARATGDQRAALSYHEKFAAADKGYLDELSARQLAYERVKHEAEEQSLQADAVRKQNQIAELQRTLADQQARAKRLYVALALVALALIGFWVYRSRRPALESVTR